MNIFNPIVRLKKKKPIQYRVLFFFPQVIRFVFFPSPDPIRIYERQRSRSITRRANNFCGTFFFSIYCNLLPVFFFVFAYL